MISYTFLSYTAAYKIFEWETDHQYDYLWSVSIVAHAAYKIVSVGNKYHGVDSSLTATP